VEIGLLQFKKVGQKVLLGVQQPIIQIERVISAFNHQTPCSDNFLSGIALWKNFPDKFIATIKLKIIGQKNYLLFDFLQTLE